MPASCMHTMQHTHGVVRDPHELYTDGVGSVDDVLGPLDSLPAAPRPHRAAREGEVEGNAGANSCEGGQGHAQGERQR